ncbi:MAG: histidine phosphatase family protein [Acholeplasmataceae bacterium]|nr:histidine phosphatase family protein [Acholeplasmataceae bacterium]
MILAIVRHGQTFYNANGIVQGRVNIPLNSVGRKQALTLGKMLAKKKESFDVIASSPLSRAIETAYIISKALDYHKPIRIEQRLLERDFFHLDGQPVDEAMPLVRQKGYTFEGYEDDLLLIKRVVKEIYNLRQKLADQKVLLIAHSHVIKALKVYINPDKYKFTDLIHNTDIFYFKVNETSIEII